MKYFRMCHMNTLQLLALRVESEEARTEIRFLVTCNKLHIMLVQIQ